MCLQKLWLHDALFDAAESSANQKNKYEYDTDDYGGNDTAGDRSSGTFPAVCVEFTVITLALAVSVASMPDIKTYAAGVGSGRTELECGTISILTTRLGMDDNGSNGRGKEKEGKAEEDGCWWNHRAGTILYGAAETVFKYPNAICTLYIWISRYLGGQLARTYIKRHMEGYMQQEGSHCKCLGNATTLILMRHSCFEDGVVIV